MQFVWQVLKCRLVFTGVRPRNNAEQPIAPPVLALPLEVPVPFSGSLAALLVREQCISVLAKEKENTAEAFA